jgi:hypothetical protein
MKMERHGQRFETGIPHAQLSLSKVLAFNKEEY